MLKTTPYSNAHEMTTIQQPDRICMHVLETARTDGRVMRAATALRDAGFAVSVIDIDSKPEQIRETIQGIDIKHVKVASSFMSTRFRRLGLQRAALLFVQSLLHLLQTPTDIYHAHDIVALPACYIAALLRRKPLIFDAHELPLKELDGPKRRWIRAVLTPILSAMIRHSAGVITASPFYAQEIRNRYHIPTVSLVRNLPPYRTVLKSDRLRQHLGLSPSVRLALYQGNVQEDRGLDVLVRAAPFLKRDVVIVIMGKAVEETLSRLQALIASERVADRVKIIPPVPYEELFDWTASADIGLNVLPPDYSLSIRYTLPNKLFEYLMAGVPVLTSELDAVTEVVRAYNVGQVVSSLAPADLASAINTMLSDDRTLTRMRWNALDVTQREFCWEKEKSQLLQLYHNILAIAPEE
jgi:glycosyltransferase involved in cell wall biosynthesis